jgi:chitinase
MSYDLVHGYSTETGHQSALYSNRSQDESIDRAVDFFRKYKFPLSKVVVGVPFYTRYFQVEDTSDNGLFKAAKFVVVKIIKTIKILWNPMALWLIGIRQHRCLTGSMQRKAFCYR